MASNYPTSRSNSIGRSRAIPAIPRHRSSEGIGQRAIATGSAGSPDDAVRLTCTSPSAAELCWYCGCNTHVASRYRPVADYRDRLLAEIDRMAEALPERLRESKDALGRGNADDPLAGGFPRGAGAAGPMLRDRRARPRLPIEIDPAGSRCAMIEALAEAGVTRASLGVQDFDPEVSAPSTAGSL